MSSQNVANPKARKKALEKLPAHDTPTIGTVEQIAKENPGSGSGNIVASDCEESASNSDVSEDDEAAEVLGSLRSLAKKADGKAGKGARGKKPGKVGKRSSSSKPVEPDAASEVGSSGGSRNKRSATGAATASTATTAGKRRKENPDLRTQLAGWLCRAASLASLALADMHAAAC